MQHPVRSEQCPIKVSYRHVGLVWDLQVYTAGVTNACIVQEIFVVSLGLWIEDVLLWLERKFDCVEMPGIKGAEKNELPILRPQ